jgi:hypothetical protein
MILILKLRDALPDADEGGEDEEDGGEAGGVEGVEGDDLQAGPRHGDHEEGGAGLSGPMRFDFDLMIEEVQHSDAAPYDGITDNDKPREPNWDRPILAPLENREDNDGGENEQFVRDGIEDRSQFGAFVKAAREESVQEISQGGDRKDGDGPPPNGLVADPILKALCVVDGQDRENRDQKEPEHRDIGGGSHEGRRRE